MRSLICLLAIFCLLNSACGTRPNNDISANTNSSTYFTLDSEGTNKLIPFLMEVVFEQKPIEQQSYFKSALDALEFSDYKSVGDFYRKENIESRDVYIYRLYLLHYLPETSGVSDIILEVNWGYPTEEDGALKVTQYNVGSVDTAILNFKIKAEALIPVSDFQQSQKN